MPRSINKNKNMRSRKKQRQRLRVKKRTLRKRSRKSSRKSSMRGGDQTTVSEAILRTPCRVLVDRQLDFAKLIRPGIIDTGTHNSFLGCRLYFFSKSVGSY